MKRIWLTFAVLFYALGAISQTAKVIPLTESETVKAKLLQKNIDDALKAQRDFEESLRQKYTQTMTMECPSSLFSVWSVSLGNNENFVSGGFLGVDANGNMVPVDKDGKPLPKKQQAAPPPPPPCKKTEKVYRDKSGWGDGFQYSEDYKYIVPRPVQTYNSVRGIGGCWTPTGITSIEGN